MTTDGGGAYIVVSDALARELRSDGPWLVATEEAYKHADNGKYDLTRSLAHVTGPRFLERAKLSIADIDFASVYDSFTITLLMNLEGLGIIEPGKIHGALADGAVRGQNGTIAVNTDGGGVSNAHPEFRGGMVRMFEAIRQLRGTATEAVQLDSPEFAIVHGSGMSHSSTSTSLEGTHAAFLHAMSQGMLEI